MKSRRVLPFLLLVACGTEAKPGPAAVTPQPESHARMVAALDEAARQAEIDNPFYGQRRLERLRADLQQAGDKAPWRLRWETAVAELEQGHEREAIAILEATRGKLLDRSLAGDAAAMIGVVFHLGVASLRLAETENCCANPTEETCILPIRGTGQHSRREGSERAAAAFLEVVQNTPKDDYWHYAAQWLLQIAHMTLGTWPDGIPAEHRLPAAAFAPEGTYPRLLDVAPAVGLDRLGTAGGVAIEDFDGDEHLDLVVTDWAPRGQARFFRNQRDGTFADRTTEAGLTGITGGLNCVHADYDDDGDMDVLVLRGGWWKEHGKLPVSLLQNDGKGHFTDVTFAVGLGERRLPTQTAGFADYDLDGDLDLYIGSESSERVACSSQLYRNDGGRFVDVAATAGVANDGYAKGVTWGDFDGDRWPDLYVSNIADAPNRLFRNRGDGTFVDVAAQAGVTEPKNSFPTWFWDFDNDGALDLFASNYDTGVAHLASFLQGGALKFDTARFFRGDGKGGFRDMTQQFGFRTPTMPMGCSFGDLDNDGWLDAYLGTGDPSYSSLMPNVFLRNVGGERVQDLTMASGLGHLQKGHGVAFADLDGDGDQDLFEVMGGAYPGDAFRCVLFENPGHGNHWLTVRVVGKDSARCAIGARLCVTVRENGVSRRIFKHVDQGASFGGNPLRQTLGLGKCTAIERLEVFWPKAGKTDVFEGVPLDTTIRVVEGAAKWERLEVAAVPFRKR
ncbi:MAG: CRTAC1 family protein [Planctomycetes bacterium]|nr:CRTAC1 family protein [Planctomycetota bacterium]